MVFTGFRDSEWLKFSDLWGLDYIIGAFRGLLRYQKRHRDTETVEKNVHQDRPKQ